MHKTRLCACAVLLPAKLLLSRRHRGSPIGESARGGLDKRGYALDRSDQAARTARREGLGSVRPGQSRSVRNQDGGASRAGAATPAMTQLMSPQRGWPTAIASGERTSTGWALAGGHDDERGHAGESRRGVTERRSHGAARAGRGDGVRQPIRRPTSCRSRAAAPADGTVAPRSDGDEHDDDLADPSLEVARPVPGRRAAGRHGRRHRRGARRLHHPVRHRCRSHGDGLGGLDGGLPVRRGWRSPDWPEPTRRACSARGRPSSSASARPSCS